MRHLFLRLQKYIHRNMRNYPVVHIVYFLIYRVRLWFLNTKNYTISVVIPCYNSQNHIVECLKSLEKVKYVALEIIIVDDASTDDTVNVIKKFQETTQLNIKTIFSNKKIGVGAARNLGLHSATGDYLTFQDSDDICHAYRFAFQLVSLLANKNKKLSLCLYYRHLQQKIMRINDKTYKKCIISMMFLRSEIISIFGGISHIKIGSDSEFRERIIAYYGDNSEIIVPIPLYFAGFSIQSNFFSQCTDIDCDVPNLNVTYSEKKITANSELMALRDWHLLIKKRDVLPYLTQKNNFHIVPKND